MITRQLTEIRATFVRSLFRLFRRTIPNLINRGGAVYIQREYTLTPGEARAGLRSLSLPHRRRSPGALGHYGLLRLFRIRRKWTPRQFVGTPTVIELGLEPTGPAGRWLLRLMPGWGESTLMQFHEELLRNASFPELARADIAGTALDLHGALAGPKLGIHTLKNGPLFLLLRLLCRFRMLPVSELRLRTVLMFRLKGIPDSLPPFATHSGGSTYLFTGELSIFSRRWNFLNRRLDRIALVVQPVVIYPKNGNRSLKGYMTLETSTWLQHVAALKRPHRVFRRSRTWHVVLNEIGRFLLLPGNYGGFEEAFPFHPAEETPWLFFLNRNRTRMEGFLMNGAFPANHLQRFHIIRSASFHPPVHRESNFCSNTVGLIDPDSGRVPQIESAIYVSRMDWQVKGRIRLPLYDLLLRRPPLDPPPVEE